MTLDGLGLFNLVEALIWFAFGVGLWVASLWRPLGFRLGRVAGAAFVLFGLSDLVEIQTRAWFRPWWLLVWKAACVIALVWSFVRYRRLVADDQAE